MTMRGMALLAFALLSACGGAGGESPPSPTPGPGVPRNPAQIAFADAAERMHAAMGAIPADADEAFMRGMLAHHRGAVEMAQVELAHGRDPEARALASAIIAAQMAEIAQMERWLLAHGVDDHPVSVPDHAGMAH